MNAKQEASWARLRTKGFVRFILVEGVIKTGGIFAVLSLIGTYLFKYGFTVSKVVGYVLSGLTISEFGFNCLFFGLCMGAYSWCLNEYNYKKANKNKT